MLVQQIMGTNVVWKGHCAAHPDLTALLTSLAGTAKVTGKFLVKFVNNH